MTETRTNQDNANHEESPYSLEEHRHRYVATNTVDNLGASTTSVNLGNENINEGASQNRHEQEDGEDGESLVRHGSRSVSDENIDRIEADDDDDEEEEGGNTTSTRRNSGIDSASRRRRVLLGVLFRILMNRRNDTNENDDDENENTSVAARLPDQPLRFLSEEEAHTLQATCRICFEGSSAAENPLLSPCNCSGGSQWIHRACLRRWQQLCRTDNRLCDVCQCRYSLRPPRPRNDYQPGNILVYMDRTNGNSTFSKSMVMILHHTPTRSTMGFIINAPIQPQYEIDGLDTPNCFDEVLWRRGGPVCGGRLGCVRYIIGHTLPLSAQDDGSESNENEDAAPGGIVIGDQYVSRSVLPSRDPTLQFVYNRDDSSSPATFEDCDLQAVLQNLANQRRRSTTDVTSTTPTRLFLFVGYSQWGRGQLCREISRGSWGVCEDGSLDDLTRPLNANYYDELVSNTMITTGGDNQNQQYQDDTTSNSGGRSRRLLVGSQLIYENE